MGCDLTAAEAALAPLAALLDFDNEDAEPPVGYEEAKRRWHTASRDCVPLDWRALYFASLAPPVARVEGVVEHVSSGADDGLGDVATLIIRDSRTDTGGRVSVPSWPGAHVGQRVSIEVSDGV